MSRYSPGAEGHEEDRDLGDLTRQVSTDEYEYDETGIGEYEGKAQVEVNDLYAQDSTAEYMDDGKEAGHRKQPTYAKTPGGKEMVNKKGARRKFPLDCGRPGQKPHLSYSLALFEKQKTHPRKPVKTDAKGKVTEYEPFKMFSTDTGTHLFCCGNTTSEFIRCRFCLINESLIYCLPLWKGY
eukprot:gb/GECG01004932.1/.p1 GENE.gb/GECG01004932.1/~~gb/GECG01004932.1/.p1  ORF type:complete len:182 (+),score=19.43 gb/GECG01004932.1/:1-546(+)